MHCLTHGEGLIDCCFLFSCLIDADRINSSDFEREAQKEIRRLTEKPDWQTAIDQLETKLAGFENRYPIDGIRRWISGDCLKRAVDFQGIYTPVSYTHLRSHEKIL